MLENGEPSELDSEVLAELDEDFTQEGVCGKAPTSQDLSAEYTANMDDLPPPLPSPSVFQFSGFSNEVIL